MQQEEFVSANSRLRHRPLRELEADLCRRLPSFACCKRNTTGTKRVGVTANEPHALGLPHLKRPGSSVSVPMSVHSRNRRSGPPP